MEDQGKMTNQMQCDEVSVSYDKERWEREKQILLDGKERCMKEISQREGKRNETEQCKYLIDEVAQLRPHNELLADERERLEICAYCNANGYGQLAVGHNKFNCHRLATLSPCEFCGASGVDNHTKSHCPSKPRVSLRLKKSYR